jgi:hypothetical protein
VYDIKFADNSRITVVCERGLKFYWFGGDMSSELPFTHGQPKLYSMADGYVGVLYEKADGGYVLNVVDKYGSEEYTADVTGGARPLQLCLSGRDAYLLTEDNVRTFSKGGEGTPLSLPDDTVERLLIRNNGRVLACTMSYATVLNEVGE